MAETTRAREAITRPDLSHLPLDVQLRIEVAETQRAAGVEWECIGVRWVLMDDGHGVVLWENGTADVRDYLNDPAALLALLERERITVVAPEDGDDDQTWWADYATAARHRDPSIGRAVCLAVLTKHGRGVSRYTPEGSHA